MRGGCRAVPCTLDSDTYRVAGSAVWCRPQKPHTTHDITGVPGRPPHLRPPPPRVQRHLRTREDLRSQILLTFGHPRPDTNSSIDAVINRIPLGRGTCAKPIRRCTTGNIVIDRLVEVSVHSTVLRPIENRMGNTRARRFDCVNSPIIFNKYSHHGSTTISTVPRVPKLATMWSPATTPR